MATPAPITPDATSKDAASANNFTTAREKLERSVSGAIGAAIKSVTGEADQTSSGAAPPAAAAAAPTTPTTAGKSSSMESPNESEPVMSVCGQIDDAEVAVEEGEEEPTASYLFRVMFGSCTSVGGGQPTLSSLSSRKGGTAGSSNTRPVRRSASKKSLRHTMIDEEEDGADGHAEQDAAIGLGEGGRRSGVAGRSRSRSQRRSSSRGRTRDVIPPAHIDGVPSPNQTRMIKSRSCGSVKKEGRDESGGKAAAAAATTTEDLIRQAQESTSSAPYHVSEVPRPLLAESMDEADAVSYCFDDGISAISAHTLEEMARENPSRKRSGTKSTQKDDPPIEEGFDITINESPRRKTTSSNSKAVSSTKSGSMSSKSGSQPAASGSSNKAQQATSAAAGTTKSSSNKGSSPTSSAAHELISTPRIVLDGSRNIRDVDESGDGVGALPANNNLVDLSRMQSSNTRSSRTTATSASSDFENAWRKDEAEFWEEEVKKSGGCGGEMSIALASTCTGDVDEDGFPTTMGLPFPVTPTKLAPKDLALMRKKLSDRSRSNDLTAPTAAMTMTPTIHNETSLDLTSISPSRHPHDTIPLDLADCVPLPPTSPMESPESPSMGKAIVGGKRRKSRKQRIHDSLVRKGRLMMMKGGYVAHPEDSATPASEIFITSGEVEVGEI